VSYSEIDTLVTNEVEAKEIGTEWSVDYMVNQSDTDTSDEEDNSDGDFKETGVQSFDSKWLHTPNPGTLLGTWNSKGETDNVETVESAEKARDAEEEDEEEVDEDEEEAEEDEVDEDEEEAEEDEVDEEEEEEEVEEEEVDEDEEEAEVDEDEDEVDEEEDEDEVDEEDDEVDEAEEDEDDVSVETDGELMVQLKKKMIEERMKLDEDADDDGLVSENDEEEDEADETDEEDDEELEVEEIEIEGITYYCTDEKNGILFECGEDGEIGDELGHLKKGTAFFS